MTDALLDAPFGRYAWQAFLHSMTMGAIVHGWFLKSRVPPGASRRGVLAAVVVLPLFTAAIPGRTSDSFRESIAWFDGARVLAVPLPLGMRVAHLALLVMAASAAATLWQEVLPALRKPHRAASRPSAELAGLVRGFARWNDIEIRVTSSPRIELAAGGWLKPRYLVVSQGALHLLPSEQLTAALAHEHEHCRPGRWWALHALFVARIVQPHSPAALWAFREHCLDVEVACDRGALRDGGPAPLARALLGVYERTPAKDRAARAAIRHRVDALLREGPADAELPPAVAGLAVVIMGGLLPWLI